MFICFSFQLVYKLAPNCCFTFGVEVEMTESYAWASFTKKTHVAGFFYVFELILHPGIYGPWRSVTDDRSPARCRFGPEFLDGLLSDIEVGHQTVVVMNTTVAPDLGDGEQLDAARPFLAQLGQAGLELGPDLLVLCGGRIAENAQLAEIDVLVFGERMKITPKDQ
jgi:hypothetical protein